MYLFSVNVIRALLEVQFLESEVSLHNASGLDPSSQHILLGRDVICFSYPLQVIQVTIKEKKPEREKEREQDFNMICNLQRRERQTYMNVRSIRLTPVIKCSYRIYISIHRHYFPTHECALHNC